MKYLLLEYRVSKLEKLIFERVVGGSVPKYFYHGTATRYVDKILKNGLKTAATSGVSTNYSISNDNAIYLTGSLDNAKKWASMTDGRGKDYAVLRIDSSYLDH